MEVKKKYSLTHDAYCPRHLDSFMQQAQNINKTECNISY